MGYYRLLSYRTSGLEQGQNVNEKTQQFLQIVRQLDAPDRWFMMKWMEMVAPAERVFVVATRATSTGPLILVGQPAEAAS